MKTKLIEEALDEFLDEYKNDRTQIYGDEKQKKAYFYRSVATPISKWKKSKKCIHSNCNSPSVQRSHTIQRSSSLTFIAENGVVLAPEYTIDGVRLKKTGLKWASTFPGFCETHERLFEDFEVNNGRGRAALTE